MLLELFTPLLSTALGIGGAFLQRGHERKMFKAQTERLVAEFAQEIELTNLQMAAKREETEQEIALTEISGNIAAFTNAQSAENQLSNIKWGGSTLGDIANFARSITRPGITWFLVISMSIRTWSYYGMTKQAAGLTDGAAIDPAIMSAAYEQMLQNPFDLALVNMTAMVVGFWFGSRGSQTGYQDGQYTRGAV